MAVNKNNMEDEYLKLNLEIEEKKFRYKISRRPLVWFWTMLSIDALLIFLSTLAASLFGGNPYLSGWGTFLAFASVIAFIDLLIYFKIDDDNGGEYRNKGIKRIKSTISSKEDFDVQKIQLKILEGFRAAARP